MKLYLSHQKWQQPVNLKKDIEKSVSDFKKCQSEYFPTQQISCLSMQTQHGNN